ncbi:hypothetical protein [Ktedonospora formicarum]|uniref:Uncharacterized protein n=1 Tax=Ktedonospora formicarum TaxID=2778364 RepID=A0A8J3MUN1_9CHLR|nr:hypothetical protein [Ktedonospora formicarum]GHO48400.1 hypothetical protein KSX_65630 [Ktedonospora formicarum]
MNGKVYYLDLQTLLDFLSVHGESCLLSKPLKEKGRTGYVAVNAGSMTSCYIQERERIVLQGEQAFKVLAQYSEWHVQLQDERPSSPPSMSPPNLSPAPNGPSYPVPGIGQPTSTSGQWPAIRSNTPSGQWSLPGSNYVPDWRPRIKRDLTQEEYLSLTVRQRFVLRLVLTMINGMRAVPEIKAQLQLSPETVDSVLAYLQARYIIE